MGVLLTPTLLSSRLKAYGIDYAALFDGASYMTYTPSITGDRKTWKLSWWEALHSTGDKIIFYAHQDANNFTYIYRTGSQIYILTKTGGVKKVEITWTPLFRDLAGAFAHCEIEFDATGDVVLKVNGEVITERSVSVAVANEDHWVNATVQHTIGYNPIASGQYSDSAFAEMVFVDGSTDLELGTFNSRTGSWIAKAPKKSDDLGHNGFYFNFSDADNLGKSQPRTTGDVYDTLNPKTLRNGSGATISDGGQFYSPGTSSDSSIFSTLRISAGSKVYLEATYIIEEGLGNRCRIGVAEVYDEGGAYAKGGSASGYWAFDFNHDNTNALTAAFAEGVDTVYGTTPSDGDVIGVVIDTVNGKMYAHTQGSYYNSGDPEAGTGAVITGLPTDIDLYLHITLDAGSTHRCALDMNFGQSDFSFKPASCSAISVNTLPAVSADDVSAHFNTVLYDGNGSTQSISGVGFQPDFVWIKGRDHTYSHALYDATRGPGYRLATDSTNAESYSANSLTSFDGDGFTLGSDAFVNAATKSFVAWCASLPSTEINSFGDISVNWKYNAALGMAVGTYAGASTGTGGYTLGLPNINGKAPKMALIKSTSFGYEWMVYHASLGATKSLNLNDIGGTVTETVAWNNTEPTGSFFTLGAASRLNAVGEDFVIICFWETDMVSVGSYLGNGLSEGPVLNGVSPTWFMKKRHDGLDDWIVDDKARDAYNPVSAYFYANKYNAEASHAHASYTKSGYAIQTSNTDWNGAGYNYVYLAIGDPAKIAMKTGNDWKSNGAISQVTSTPTNTYATMNPLDKNGAPTFSNGNTTVNLTSTLDTAFSTITIDANDADGYYLEVEMDTVTANGPMLGWVNLSGKTNTDYWGVGAIDVGYTTDSAAAIRKKQNNVQTSITGATTPVNGTRLKLLVKNGKCWIGEVGVGWFDNADPETETNPNFSNLSGQYVFQVQQTYTNTVQASVAFAEADWVDTPPAGAKSICTDNLPVQSGDISDHFNTVLWTGDGGTGASGTVQRSITGLGFSPDLINIKARDASGYWNNWSMLNTLQGIHNIISMDSTNAEQDTTTDFTHGYIEDAPDGFDIYNGSAGEAYNYDENSVRYVGYGWSLPSSETNTSGDIPVDWIYNATLGVSVGTYTGTGIGGDTLGLPAINGEAPKMVIVKSTSDGTTDWAVYHSAVGGTKYGKLNLTDTFNANSSVWNDTDPTSSSVTLGSGSATNGSSKSYVVIAFWETDFCKIGSYIGNANADGPYVNLGGAPVWLLSKRTDSSSNWRIRDNVRSPHNAFAEELYPDLLNGEIVSGLPMDFLSNGFKWRSSNVNVNASGGTYIYLAFVQPNGPTENPAR